MKFSGLLEQHVSDMVSHNTNLRELTIGTTLDKAEVVFSSISKSMSLRKLTMDDI